MSSRQAYILENKLHRWPRHLGKMRTWSTIMVRILPVDGPHVCRSAFCHWPNGVTKTDCHWKFHRPDRLHRPHWLTYTDRSTDR